MKSMTVQTLAALIHAPVKGDGFVTGVNVDTRKVVPGDLFVCLRGERVDGHNFATEAISRGAQALLVDRYLDIDIPQIKVSDTLKGLTSLAAAYKQTLTLSSIAITGSNGKTSTKDILYSVLSKQAATVATFENQNTEIGTCLTIFRCDKNTQYGVFEMGLDFPDEIKAMTAIVKPDIAILTSLDQAHMTSFEGMEHLAKEKFSIFDVIKDKTHCFYQGDYPLYRQLALHEQSFGFSHDNNFVIKDVQVYNDGVSFSLLGKNYHCNLLGKHQASNAAGAVLALQALGIGESVITEGLQTVALTSMRMEPYKFRQASILFDAYKASPKSMIAALEFFSDYEFEGERVAVLADMFDLGEGSEDHHRNVLEAALNTCASRIFLFGPEFKKTLSGFDSDRIIWFNTKDLLLEALAPYYNQNCLILFKGSRTYQLETLLEGNLS